MHRAAAIALLLAACGRRGFDERDGGTPDVQLANHDEDGDGVDDAIDVCPMVPDNQADVDHDGVGTACDADDTRPGDHFVLFDPMMSKSPDVVTTGGTWVATGDELRLTTVAFSTLERMFPITNADIWFGADIVSTSGTTQQLIIHPSAMTQSPRYYVQLYTTPGTNEAAIIQYDGMTFISLAKTPLGGNGVHTGSLVMVARVRTNPPALSFAAGWPGETYALTAPTLAYTGSPQIRFMIDGLLVSVRNCAVIATPLGE